MSDGKSVLVCEYSKEEAGSPLWSLAQISFANQAMQFKLFCNFNDFPPHFGHPSSNDA